jgi:hypothetical protein
MTTALKSTYHSTESKYKGKAREMYITYNLDQRTRGGGSAQIPKIRRVYIAGNVRGWTLGDFRKRSGREVHGVRIEYAQSRRRYRRAAYRAARRQAEYEVPPTSVKATTQRFTQIVELPLSARNVRFYTDQNRLPKRFQHALQRVR